MRLIRPPRGRLRKQGCWLRWGLCNVTQLFRAQPVTQPETSVELVQNTFRYSAVYKPVLYHCTGMCSF